MKKITLSIFLLALSLVGWGQKKDTIYPEIQLGHTGCIDRTGTLGFYVYTKNGPEIMAGTPTYGSPKRGWATFMISDIPQDATITSIQLFIYPYNPGLDSWLVGDYELQINEVVCDIEVAKNGLIWDDIGDGANYYKGTALNGKQDEWVSILLNNQVAVPDLQAKIDAKENYWTIGFMETKDNNNTPRIYGYDNANRPFCIVEYDIENIDPLKPNIAISPLYSIVDEGDPFSLTASVSGGNEPYSYQWYFNGNPIGTNSESYEIVSAESDSAGSYYCIVTDNIGEKDTSRTATLLVRTIIVPDKTIDNLAFTSLNGEGFIFAVGEDCPDGILKYGTPSDNSKNPVTGTGGLFLSDIGPNNKDWPLWPEKIPYSLTVDGSSLSFLNPVNSSFNLAGMDVNIGPMDVQCDQVTFNCNFQLPTILEEEDKPGKPINWDLGLMVSHAGIDCGVDIQIPKVKLADMVTLNYLNLSFNTQRNDYAGSAAVKTKLLSISGGAIIRKGKLDSVGVYLSCDKRTPVCQCCVPLANTGLEVFSAGGRMYNMANPNKKFTIGASFGIQPVALGSLTQLELTADYAIPNEFIGTAKIKLLTANIYAEIGLFPGSFDFKGNVNFMAGIVDGYAALNISRSDPRTLVRGQFGANLGCPKQENIDKLKSIFLRTILSNYKPGEVLAKSKNFLTNDYIAGYAWLNIPPGRFTDFLMGDALKWDGKFYYSLYWDTDKLKGKFGTQFEEKIPYPEARQALTSKKGETSFSPGNYLLTVDSSTTSLLIEAYKDGGLPQMMLYLANGDSVTKQNVTSFDNINYGEFPKEEFSMYYLKNPSLGTYRIKVADADSIHIFRANNPPFIDLTGVTLNQSTQTLNVGWKDSDLDGDATISIGYDRDNSGANGVLLVEGISEDDATDFTTIDFSDDNIPTGTYYIYAIIEDALHQNFVSYWKHPIDMTNDNGLLAPSNFTCVANDTSLMFSWSKNNPSPVTYVLYYSNDTGSVGFSSRSAGVGDTDACVFSDFTPGLYYEFMLTAMDTDYFESAPSNVVTILYEGGSQNKAPYILKQNFHTAAYVDADYSYQVKVVNRDNDALIWTIPDGPYGLTVDNTGTIHFNPADSLIGYNQVTVKVCDPGGLCDSVHYQIFVANELIGQSHVEFNKALLVNYNEDAMVLISDPDRGNGNSVNDSVMIRIYSESDGLGIYPVVAKETEPQSGQFLTDFTLSDKISDPAKKQLLVKKGDKIWAEYYDASFAKQVKGETKFAELEAGFLTDVEVICSGDSVQFTDTSKGDAIIGHLWQLVGNAQLLSTEDNPKLIFTVPAGSGYDTLEIQYTIFDNEYDTAVTVQKIIVARPMSFANDTLGVCLGETTILMIDNKENSAESFLWSNGSTNYKIETGKYGTYTVTVTDGNDCISAPEVYVTQYPTPVIKGVLGADRSACGPVLLDTKMSAATVLWSNGDGTPETTIYTSDTVWAKVTNVFNCTSFDTVVLQINSKPAPNLGFDATVCEGTTLDAKLSGMQYVWSTGSSNKEINISETGMYTLTVTNNAGCSAIDSIYLNVEMNVFADFDYSCDSLRVSFTNTSLNDTVVLWNFGDGHSTEENNPVHTYQVETDSNFTVTLIASNNCSKHTISNVISVSPTSVMQFYNTSENVSIYPNPSAGKFTITYYNVIDERIEIRITDPIGRHVFSSIYSGEKEYNILLDLKHYPNGIYNVMVTGRDMVYIRKIIKHE